MYLLDTDVLSELKKLPSGRANAAVSNWAFRTQFAGRILVFGLKEAQVCAELHVPDPGPYRDSMIAATALVHGLTVVTRNVKDFTPLKVPIINPWD